MALKPFTLTKNAKPLNWDTKPIRWTYERQLIPRTDESETAEPAYLTLHVPVKDEEAR